MSHNKTPLSNYRVIEVKFYLYITKYKNKIHVNSLKPKERERERVRKDGKRVEIKRKHLRGKAKGALYLRGRKKEHFVRRYPGSAHSSF
jgi:hypothetical protein